MRNIFGMLVVLSALAVGVIGRARADEKPVDVGTLDVPAGMTISQVKDSVVACVLGREWSVKEQSDGKVVGYLKHRSNEAEITFLFDEKQIKMSCWGYKIEKSTGKREDPELPKGWINNLKKDITRRLNSASSGRK